VSVLDSGTKADLTALSGPFQPYGPYGLMAL
jgi:hypothetical protein